MLVILAWCGMLSILAWMFQWGLSVQHLPEEEFLSNIFTPAELEEGLLRLRASPPRIKMSMAAFHEETEWVERSDGEETTINYETMRYYAWKSIRFYKYTVWQDFTEPVNLGKLAESNSLTALDIQTICLPGDQLTKGDLMKVREAFMEFGTTKDKMVELNVEKNYMRIDGKEAFDVVPYRKGNLNWTSDSEVLINEEESLAIASSSIQRMAVANDPSNIPCWMRETLMKWLDILALSALLRIFTQYMAAHIKIKIVKKFFVHNDNTDKGFLVHPAEQMPDEEIELDNPDEESMARSSQEIHTGVLPKLIE